MWMKFGRWFNFVCNIIVLQKIVTFLRYFGYVLFSVIFVCILACVT